MGGTSRPPRFAPVDAHRCGPTLGQRGRCHSESARQSALGWGTDAGPGGTTCAACRDTIAFDPQPVYRISEKDRPGCGSPRDPAVAGTHDAPVNTDDGACRDPLCAGSPSDGDGR